jgi:hypothetical protein
MVLLVLSAMAQARRDTANLAMLRRAGAESG